MTSFSRKSNLIVLVGLLMLMLTACGSSSEGDPDVDGDGISGGCSTDADCMVSTTNRICGSAGTCINQGLCGTDADCKGWYGSAWSCGASGVCENDGTSPDGDDNHPDGDDNIPDGDDPVEGCTDFTGLYDGEFVCGGTETIDTYVVVDYNTCSIIILYGEEEMTGDVHGDNITTNSGKNCTGSGTWGDSIHLSCTDGCEIDLTWKVSSGEGNISTRPTELRFGAVALSGTAQQDTYITNNGDGDLTIRQIFFTPETSDEFTLGNPQDWELPITLQSTMDRQLWVVLSVAVEEAKEGMLVIISDAANSPVLRIRLSSQVKEVPRIGVDPSALDFGTSPPGYDNLKYFLVRNIGGATARVTGVDITDSQDGAFALAPAPEMPMDIEARGSEPVQVNCKPIEGTHTPGTTLVGRADVTWLNKDDQEETVGLDLLCRVVDQSPACLDISPLDGSVGWMGLGELPGPGIKYGYSQIAAAETRQVTIKNCGDLPLEVNNMVWNEFGTLPLFTQRAFYETPGQLQNYTLQRGQSVYLDITFTPQQEGALYAAQMNLLSNAETWSWLPADYTPLPDAPPLSETVVAVGFSGTGARRGIEVLPSKLDFGLITLECCSRPENLSVYNIGDLALEITGIGIGAGSDTLFDLLGLPSSYPTNLGGPGNPQSLSFQVKFCPSHEGPHEGRVEIVSNDNEDQMFVVPLHGEGTLLSHQIDEFDQITHPMVDVLWDVDCSGSMGDEQDRLADNFEVFIDEAISWNADLHLAVIAADIVDSQYCGRFQGSPSVLANRGPGALTDAQIKDKFVDRIHLGTSCDGGQEAALEAAHLALSEPLISNENAGFLREDAKLSIVFVSDEADQSVADVPFFIDFFRSLKGMRNVNMIEIYAIVGDKNSGCQLGSGDNASTADPGPRYIEVADACNVNEDEHFMSICEASYQPVYDTMAENLFALKIQFFLSRLADPDTLVVTVDGTVRTDYEYDENSNSIIFDESSPPDPGSHIVAEYDTVCLR